MQQIPPLGGEVRGLVLQEVVLNLRTLSSLAQSSTLWRDSVKTHLERRFSPELLRGEPELLAKQPQAATSRRSSLDDRDLVLVLTNCETLAEPLRAEVSVAWASDIMLSGDHQASATDGFRMISGPLSELAGRPVVLPAPALGSDAYPDMFFSFGLWTVWVSTEHGFLAVDNASGNLILASCDGDCEAGVLTYNALADAEVMVTDSGIQRSPFHDSNGYFERLCEVGGQCRCDGSMYHNSTFPYHIAVSTHNLVPSESSNLDAADALREFMRSADPLVEDVHCAWRAESDEGQSIWWHVLSDVEAEALYLVCVQGPAWIQVWHTSKYRSKVAFHSTNSSVLSNLRDKLGRIPLVNLDGFME